MSVCLFFAQHVLFVVVSRERFSHVRSACVCLASGGMQAAAGHPLLAQQELAAARRRRGGRGAPRTPPSPQVSAVAGAARETAAGAARRLGRVLLQRCGRRRTHLLLPRHHRTEELEAAQGQENWPRWRTVFGQV